MQHHAFGVNSKSVGWTKGEAHYGEGATAMLCSELEKRGGEREGQKRAREGREREKDHTKIMTLMRYRAPIFVSRDVLGWIR